MKTKSTVLAILLMTGCGITFCQTTAIGGHGETQSSGSLQHTASELFAYVEFLEGTVIDFMEEINDCKEVTLIKDGIITNVERDVMNLGLVVNEYARVNGELLQQNLALRSKVDLALTDKILAFGLSVVGSACLFVNNKTVNWVGVGLLGAGFVFTIR